MYDTILQPGFHNLNTYLVVPKADVIIEFLKQAFEAVETNRTVDEDSGRIMNVILRQGDPSMMISEASGQFGASSSSFYLFVEDCDAVYKRALEAGATSLMPPADMPYADHNAGVKDMAGNNWWIATRQVEGGYQD